MVFFHLNCSIFFLPSKPHWIRELKLQSAREGEERKGKVSHEKKRGWFACQHLNPDREAGPAERPGGEGEHSSSDFQRLLTGFLLRRPGSRQHTFLPLIAADETLMLLLSSQHLAHAKCSDPSHSKELWLSLACQTWTGLGSDTDGLRSCSVLTW